MTACAVVLRALCGLVVLFYRIFWGGVMGRWVAGRWTLWSSRSLVRVVGSSSRREGEQEREEKVQPVKDCGRSWRSMGSPGLI